MAKKEKQKSTTTTTKSTARWSFQKMLDCFAYFGTACIAIALILSVIFKGNGDLFKAFSTVGTAIAYILSMILAAFWVKRKRHIAWLICYIIFVVIIIVMYIVTLV